MTRTIVILLTGFLQPPHLSNGLAELKASIQLDPACPTGLVVVLKTWRADQKTLVRMIAADKSDRVILAGHSFGGAAVVELSAALKAEGVKVTALCLSDAVGHLDADSQRTLTVPANVVDLYSWRRPAQKPNGFPNVPHGSPIELADDKATHFLLDEKVEGVGHAAMDSLPQFVRTVRTLVMSADSAPLKAKEPDCATTSTAARSA